MRNLLSLLSVLVLLVWSPLHAAEREGSRLRIVSGLYYDNISQGYYLSATDTLTLDEDSLLALKRTSDEINDLRLKTSADWTVWQSDAGQIELGSVMFLSDDDLRSSIDARFRRGALELIGGLEGRGIWDIESSGSGYATWRLSSKLRPSLGSGFFLLAKDSYESVNFSGTDDFNYDYRYNRFYLGVEKEFGWADLLSLQYRNDRKQAPDSSRLDYTNHRAIIEFDWSPSTTISTRIESDLIRRLSNKETGIDDGWEELLDATLGLRFAQRWELEVRHELEYATYDTQDVVNNNHMSSVVECEMLHSPTEEIEVSGTLSTQQYRTKLVEFVDQDYEQYSIRYGLDISSGEWLWFDISHTVGHRNYIASVGGFYTDYTMNRLDIFGDLKLYHGLSLNSMISIDWENHEKQENDNRLSLISIGLDYAF